MDETGRDAGEPSSETRKLADLTNVQAAYWANIPTILVVPVGSTEQHGPHLPVSTDTDIAVHLSNGLALHRDDVLVAPAIPYGSSGEHQGFAGTLSIGQAATRLLLIELVRSATATFRRVLLVVGHGGNAEPVNAAVSLLRTEGHAVMAWAPQLPGDSHAGRTETSVMLALSPDSVDLAAAAAGETRSLRLLLPRLRHFGVAAVSPNGVLGDPAGANATEGRALLDGALSDLCERVDAWAGRDPRSGDDAGPQGLPVGQEREPRG
jgi:creatinine amidohydrolase